MLVSLGVGWGCSAGSIGGRGSLWTWTWGLVRLVLVISKMLVPSSSGGGSYGGVCVCVQVPVDYRHTVTDSEIMLPNGITPPRNQEGI